MVRHAAFRREILISWLLGNVSITTVSKKYIAKVQLEPSQLNDIFSTNVQHF